MKKALIFFCVLLCLLSAAAVCYAAQFSNQGTVLNIPDEYIDLLVIDVPENSENGILYSLSEKASIESAARQGITWEGVGWLFSISRVDEDTLHEMQCYNMFGSQVFAKDQKGDYYLFNHPTDVRMVREDYSDPKGLEEWSYVYNLGDTIRESFITDNFGLTPEKYSNTDLDIALSRILYKDDTQFTVSTTQFGPLDGKRETAAAFIEKLTEGTIFEYQFDMKEAPDGEYVVLNFPEEGVRFDFFRADENCIRQVWTNMDMEMFYKAVNEDEGFKATKIMNDLYLTLAAEAGLYQAAEDAFSGTYVNGRCGIEISAGTEEGSYNVLIHWGNSASETMFWSMTAKADEDTLRYEDCRKYLLTSVSPTEIEETTLYENGRGSFVLQTPAELVWDDRAGNQAPGLIFEKQ